VSHINTQIKAPGLPDVITASKHKLNQSITGTFEHYLEHKWGRKFELRQEQIPAQLYPPESNEILKIRVVWNVMLYRLINIY